MATRLSDLELFGPENRPTAERRRASRSPSRNRLTDDELFGASEERETAGYRAPVRDPLDDYTDAEYIAQGALELAKGIPSGAARMYGTALQGAGALQEGMEATAANRGLNTDSLERLRPFHETIAAGGLDEQSAAQLIKDAQEQLNPVEASHVREAVEDALAGDEQAGEFIAPDRTLTTQSQIDNNPLIGAGRAVNTYADRILPAAPGFEESITRQLGEGLGSLFAAVPLSAAGGPITASTFFALAGSGEAVERALRAGASPDDVIAAGRAGILPGLTDSMPLEILMGRLPIPGGKFAGTLLKVGDDMIGKAMRAMGRIGTQAFVEGIQEGGQGFLQNLIAQEIYAPEQELLEGIGPDAALGAGVGGIAQAAKEIGAGLLQQFAGRRGAVTVTLPDGTTGVAQVPQGAREQASSAAVDLTPEDNASPLPNDLIARGKQIMGDAGASSDAGAILQEMGLPGPESRVTVTIGGRTVPGTIVDGFRVEVAEMGVNEPGVKIALDDGTVFEETTTGLQQRGVQIAAEAPAAPAGEVSAPAGVPGGPGAPSATPAAPAAQPPAPTGGGMLPGGAPVGDGTPSAPVVAQTPEDVDRAAGLVNTAPTDGQKEAGNYKHGHVRVAGLDIAIETPLGAERSGTDPNGQPWSVTMPAHYGRLKRTEGADGEQVDVYLGDNLQSQTVYIIDQGDADSGAFDEHKVMLGFSTEDEAVATYDAAFNDGRGPDRRQAITTMSLDEFRDWLSDGDTTSAVAGAGTEPSGNTVQLPGEAQETADQAPVNVPEQSGGAIRRNSAQYGTITTGPLVAPYGTTDQQRRILDRAAKKFDGAKVRQADGRWQLDLPRNASPETRTAAEAEIERQTNITVAKSERGRAQGGPKRGAMGLAEYIARNGGIVDVGGELTAADMQIWHQGKPGMPKVIISREQATEKGHAAAEKSPDEWLVRAKEQGYLPQDATLSDLFEAITTNQHKPDEAVADAARPDARADQEATDRSEDLHAEVKAASRRLDLLLGESEITAVMEIMAANPQMDAEAAIEEYIESAETEAADEAHDATENDDYDIPFGAPGEDAAGAGAGSERPEGARGDAEEGGAGGAAAAQARSGEGEAGPVTPTSESVSTVDGKRDQFVIPGAEQSAKQAAEGREAEGKGKLKAKTGQKDADEGLFGGPPEAELFDQQPAPAAPEAQDRLVIQTGVVLRTKSGRETAPAPKIDASTDRKATATIKRMNAWLLDEAMKETASVSYHQTLLRAIDLNNISQSDQDTINDLLFGDPDGPTQANVVRVEAPEKAPKSAPSAAQPPAAPSYGESNKVFTKDAAEAARERLRKKLRDQLNAGLDPEMMQDGITMAGYHIEAGARTFAQFARAMIADLGDNVRPYLKSWYNAARDWPGFDNQGMDAYDVVSATDPNGDFGDVSGEPSGVEPDRGDAGAPDGVRPPAVSPERGGDGEGARGGGQEAGSAGDRQPGGANVLPGDGAAPVGEGSNRPVPAGQPGRGGGASQRGGGGRGSRNLVDGPGDDRLGEGNAGAPAPRKADLGDRKAAQAAADRVAVKPGDLDNIRETLPLLLPTQQEDVAKAEARFSLRRPERPVLVRNASTPAPTFDNPESEARLKAAMKGVAGTDSLVARTRDWLDYQIIHGFSRHFIHLPNVPRFADLAQQLRKLQASPGASKERIVRMLREITKGMTPADLDLFTRKVILDDLAWEVEQEHDLPFAMSPEDVRRELSKVDAILADRPDLTHAVRTRKVMSRAIAEQLVQSGVLSREAVKNPAYYRHQVLEYANGIRMLSGGRPSYEVMVDGTKKRLRTPHWARREGSTKDINANYLEAEFDWLHKALMDIDTARTITWIKESEHNARDETVAAAKEHNRQLIDRALAKDIRERGFQKGEDSETGAPIMSSPLNEEWEGFGQSIAIGLSIVRRQLNAGQVPPELRPAFNALEEGGSSDDVSIFPLLSWIMDNDMPGASGAGMVFKAITSRKAWSRELLGEKWADPMNVGDLVRRGFAPEGSVAWQPDEGRLMFTAKTISEHAMDRMVMMLADEDAGPLDKGEVRRVLESVRPMLAVGGPKYQMVLPAEIAATLNSLRDDYVDSFIEGIVTVPMRWWKRWVLINPRRVVKYNLNNLSGDLDAVIAGNPRVLRRLPQAIKELYAVTYNGAQPSARFQEAVARGVFDSGLTMQEIPDINFMSEFEAITDKPSLARVDKQTLRLLRKTWRFLQRATTFRENWARYAAYLEYADRLEAGESVAKIGYGASLPKMVEALADPQDQAALLARDLVGDYGALSRNGEWLRSHMIPFWSWIEINSKRYWRLVGNAYGQGVGKGIAKTGMVGAVLGARTSVYLGLRMAVLYGLITLWNNLMFPDEEEELDSTQRVRLHLNLGRDRDGVNRTLRIQGAFSDALGWFGFEDAIGMLMEVERGRATYEDVLAAIAKAPVNRIGTSLTPVIQVPLTLATGQKLWPDLFETRRVNDRLREVASTFSMENEYDLLFDKPSRGYLRSWRNSVIYTSEADEQAYYRIRNLVYDWRERERGVSGGSSEGPRTDAYREWKMALRFGDDDAAEDARQRLRDLGASAQDMQTSLRNAAPLGPLAIKDRGAFKRSLTPTERELLERADDWYRETFLSR